MTSVAVDKGAPIGQSARICASAARRSKTDLTKCDPTAGIVDIVSFLGPYIIFESNAETETQETQTKTQVDAFNIIRFILSVWLFITGGRNIIKRGSYSQICFCQKKLDM